MIAPFEIGPVLLQAIGAFHELRQAKFSNGGSVSALRNWKIVLKALSKRLWKLTIMTTRLQ
jgi:hypothetical protein